MSEVAMAWERGVCGTGPRGRCKSEVVIAWDRGGCGGGSRGRWRSGVAIAWMRGGCGGGSRGRWRSEVAMAWESVLMSEGVREEASCWKLSLSSTSSSSLSGFRVSSCDAIAFSTPAFSSLPLSLM